MQAVAFIIKHNKYRKTKALRITKFGKQFFVLVFLAVVYMYNYIIGAHIFIQLRVMDNQIVKTDAPDTPVAANLQQHIFMLCGSLFNSIGNIGLCIGIGVI